MLPLFEIPCAVEAFIIKPIDLAPRLDINFSVIL